MTDWISTDLDAPNYHLSFPSIFTSLSSKLRMLRMINRCYVFKFEFLHENSFLWWTVTLTPQKITYLILSWFFIQNYAGKTTLLAVLNLDLNIIFVMNSHTHSHKKSDIIFEIFSMKNYAGKTTLFCISLWLNIFLVMNSHTQLFFDFGMWG